MIEATIIFTLLIMAVTSGERHLVSFSSAVEGSGFACVHHTKPTLKGREYHVDTQEGERVILYRYEIRREGSCND